MKDWGTDIDFNANASQTDVAVIDQPGTGTGAETTSEVPSTSTEVSPVIEKGAISQTATDTTQAKGQGKEVDQDKQLAEFGKTLSGKNKESWDRLISSRNEATSKYSEAKQIIDALAEKGIHSPDDAAFIAQQRDTAQQQIQQLTAQVSEFKDGFTNDPIQFAFRLQKDNPQAWGSISSRVLLDGLSNEAARLEQAALRASGEVAEGQQWSERDRILDQARFVRELASEAESRYGSAVKTPVNGSSNQKEQELIRREQEFQQRQDAEWQGKIGDSVGREVTSRIDKFVKGVEFIDDEQRQDFYDAVMSKVKESFDARPNFLEGSWQKAMGQNRGPGVLSDVAKRYGLESERAGLLEGIIAKRLRLMGLEAKSAEANRQATVAKASERKEVARGGIATGGPDQAARKAEIFAAIDKEFPSGSIENSAAKTAWRSRL